MSMLGKEDYLNICRLMEKTTTIYNGIEEAAAGFILYNKLKVCLQQIENPAPLEPVVPDSPEKLAVVPEVPDPVSGDEEKEESNDGEN